MKSLNTYDNFVQFYQNEIAHINSIRIDGNIKGGNRKSAGTFKFNNDIWKVHQDSDISPLKIAFEAFSNNQIPFTEVDSKGNKGRCLILNPNIYGDSDYKNMYIYKVKKV